MAQVSLQMVAGGTIRRSRFCKVSTAADSTLLEADAGEVTIGISHESAQDAPIPGAGTDAAAAGEAVRLYVHGDVALLEIGSGDITRGAFCKSDADGKGVASTADDEWYGAIALESASEGELARVFIMSGYISGAADD